MLDMTLIYPLISYEAEFYIEDHWEAEEKKLKKEIEKKKAEALEKAFGIVKKMDFVVERDCYIPRIEVRDYVFEVHTEYKNSEGNVIKKPAYTFEQLDDMEFKNQIYERLIRKMENGAVKSVEKGEKGMFDLSFRDKWLKQNLYA